MNYDELLFSLNKRKSYEYIMSILVKSSADLLPIVYTFIPQSGIKRVHKEDAG